jgi:hypothetical protein
VFFDGLCNLDGRDRKVRKKELLLSDFKPDNEIDGLAELLNVPLELDETDRLVPSKIKYKEISYINIFDTWLEHNNPMGAALSRLIDNHQRVIEFEEGWEFLFGDRHSKGFSEEIFEFLANWEQRAPSKRRSLETSRKIMRQRNIFTRFLMTKLSRFVEENRNFSNSQIELLGSNTARILLNDGTRIPEQVLVNELLMTKIERKIGAPISLKLNEINYSAESLSKVCSKVLCKLFKENLANGNNQNSDVIFLVAMTNNSPEIRSDFHVRRAKHFVKHDQINDALEAIAEAYKTCSYNGKLYVQLFEALSKAFFFFSKPEEDINQYWVSDFFDSMFKILYFDYGRYANKVFYNLLCVVTMQRNTDIPFGDKLKNFILRSPAKFLRTHFYEIGLFFDETVVKSAYERLCQSNLHEFYYILANLTIGVKSEISREKELRAYMEKDMVAPSTLSFGAHSNRRLFYHEEIWKEAVKILTNYLPRKILLVKSLHKIASKIFKETGIESRMTAKMIIEEVYKVGNISGALIKDICRQQPALEEVIDDLRSQNISRQERLMSLLQILDQNFNDVKPFVGKKIFEESLISNSKIVLERMSKNLIKIDASNMFDEFEVCPYVKIIQREDTYGLSLKLGSRSQKKKTLLILPRGGHNLVDNLIHGKLQTLLGEIYLPNIRTHQSYAHTERNLLFLSKKWYAIEK